MELDCSEHGWPQSPRDHLLFSDGRGLLPGFREELGLRGLGSYQSPTVYLSRPHLDLNLCTKRYVQVHV